VGRDRYFIDYAVQRLIFDETLTTMKVAGLTTLVAGIVLIKSGTRKPANSRRSRTMQQFEWVHAAWLARHRAGNPGNVLLKFSDVFAVNCTA
jgi:hypothetical protein